MEGKEKPTPTPRPRRTGINPSSTQYENIIVNTKVNIDEQKNNLNIKEDITINKNIIEQKEASKTAKDEKIENRPVKPVPAPRQRVQDETYDPIYQNEQFTKRSSASEVSFNELHNTDKEVPRKVLKECHDSSRLRSLSVGDSKETEFTLTKSISTSTIDSSISSASSADNSKYKKPSPSDLLKSLGTTSRLLTESISERVSAQAKGAKKKLDKNLKTSQHLLTSLGSETSCRLKSVRKKMASLGINNFSLQRGDHVNKDTSEDRPKTMPVNDEIFKSISFNSPLNKTTNTTDLTQMESSYEIPKNIKRTYSPSPPPYNEVVKVGEQNSNLSLKSDENEQFQNVSKSTNAAGDRNSHLRKSLPMPNYPPPVLSEDHIYGKLKTLTPPPARPKRKKDYETVSLRNNCDSLNSNRVVSLEFYETTDASSRNNSDDKISTRINDLEESERCESWSYRESESGLQTPEPIYANQEMTYGQIFDMESRSPEVLLTPEVKDSVSFGDVSGIEEISTCPEILDEFDPLKGTNLTQFSTEKSNQLLLLESLLTEETYGTLPTDKRVLDDHSLASSDEDNGNVAAAFPIPPKRYDSLQQSTASANCDPNDLNNYKNSSESKPLNSVPAVAKVRNDQTEPLQSRTNWFLDENYLSEPKALSSTNLNSNMNLKKITKKPFPEDQDFQGPPSYAEAMADSNLESQISPEVAHEVQSKSSVKTMFSNVFNKMDVLKRKTSFRGARGQETRIALEMIPKPILSQRLVRHEGPLIRFPSGVVEDIFKEIQNRKAILLDRRFQTFQDQEMKNQKECLLLEHITTIQCISNSKVTDNATHLYCFEITTAIPKNQTRPLFNPNVVVTNNNSGNCKLTRTCHLYGVGKESERDIWMQKLIESLTTVFPTKLTCQYYRAGWCYLKTSISSTWSGTWLLLKKRKRRLIFYTDAGMNLERMDLKKARCIVLQEPDESTKNLHVESGPVMMIDCPPYTVYLVMSCSRETKIWKHIIKEVAHNNGPALSEQQLTKYSVPVIVDKCINFVYIHGSMSEGIYRKSGSENAIQKLISLFRADAFSVEVTRNLYNEHDVANVLKRFMRGLPQRLLGKHSVSFICVTEVKSVNERISCYKDLLGRLSEIEYNTLKKLIGHLAFISSQKNSNKMEIHNLAVIWGPTLLQNADDEATYSKKETEVIAQLITLYKHIFPLSADEIRKEQEMLQCLKKYYAAAESLSHSVKKSGDLKVWINIEVNSGTKLNEKKQINVTLTPVKTVHEVCTELAVQIKVPVHQITLHEVILDSTLDRPLHHSEKLFDVVLRWSYWPEDDRKNNHLVLKSLELLKEVDRALKNLATLTPGKDLKFADIRTKSVKTYLVELRDSRILVSKKEKNLPVCVNEIPLRNVTAYLGCEKKRDFQWGWAITFIEKENKAILRSRDMPFIGPVLGGSLWEDRIIWFSSIWYNLYGDDFMPPPEMIIK